MTNGQPSDDPDWKEGNKKRKRKKRKGKKNIENKVFELFSEKHLDRLMDDHPDMSAEEAQKYLQHLWDSKDEDQRAEYVVFL